MKSTVSILVLFLLLPGACGRGGPGFVDGTFISFSGAAPFAGFEERAEKDEIVDFDLSEGVRLALRTRGGPIRVRTTDGRPRVEAHFVIYGRTKAEAERALDGFRLARRETDDGFEIAEDGEPLVITEGSRTLRILPHVQLVASVPPGSQVAADSGSGDIDVEGPLGPCRLKTGYGKVRASDIDGDLEATSGSGAVRVDHVKGSKVVAASSYGAIVLDSIEGDEVQAKTGSGDVEATSVEAARIRLRSQYGHLRITDVRGRLEGGTSSGSVVVSGAEEGPFELSSGYGIVKIENATGDVRAKSSSGNLEIRADGAVTAETNYGTIRIAGTLTAVDARSASGAVTVDARPGSAARDPWILRSSYGAISATLPRDFACELCASTSYGRIDCGFEVLVAPGRSDPRKLVGKIGAGGPELRIEAGSGNIDILRGPAQP